MSLYSKVKSWFAPGLTFIKGKKTCAHCNEPIRYDEVFGWYHGDITGGWNTSCVGDENMAWPKGEPEPQEKDHVWRCKDVYGKYVRVWLLEDEIANNPEMMDFIEDQIKEQIPANHKHTFVNLVISPDKETVYHDCPGKSALTNYPKAFLKE